MFETIIVQPLLNLLFVLYTGIPGHDFGIAVIVLTVIIRFALYPLAKKQLHSQKALSEIQPEINKLKEKYKDPKEFQAKTMELYKEKEINPFGSCLPLLLQFPFLIGLFYVFLKFQDANFLTFADGGILNQIYPWVQELSFVKAFTTGNTAVDTTFFGITDLAHPNIYLAVVAGALQFVQSKMLTPKKAEGEKANMATQMTYIFPVLTVVIAMRLPAALPVYWATTTLFAIVQQYLIMHREVETLEEKSERKRSKKSKRNRK
ncbi:MAG: YidC/Oxa1 family membrane protein insertase [Patescibacteria group bacterium]|nr:YidC/Oxa1 family membrane protein insertase [Patescibacteria group bacterium]